MSLQHLPKVVEQRSNSLEGLTEHKMLGPEILIQQVQGPENLHSQAPRQVGHREELDTSLPQNYPVERWAGSCLRRKLI